MSTVGCNMSLPPLSPAPQPGHQMPPLRLLWQQCFTAMPYHAFFMFNHKPVLVLSLDHKRLVFCFARIKVNGAYGVPSLAASRPEALNRNQHASPFEPLNQHFDTISQYCSIATMSMALFRKVLVRGRHLWRGLTAASMFLSLHLANSSYVMQVI